MKRVIFVTDSLGAPRNEDITINIDNTWCNIVSVRFKDYIEPFYHLNNGFDSQTLIKKKAHELILYKPDLIILQVGIVDCAPRVLKKNELRVINHLGVISKLMHRFIKNRYSRLSLLRNISYVDKEEFEANLRDFVKILSPAKVIAVAIAKPSNTYVEKSPLISERYLDYNNILSNIFEKNYIDPYIDLNEELEEIYINDGYHLNKKGHKLVARKVIEHLSSNNVIL